MSVSKSDAALRRSAKRAAQLSVAWSFECTLELSIHDASQGMGSGGIVHSTELFSKVLKDRHDYQGSSLKTLDVVSFSSSRGTSRVTQQQILHVNGFVHSTTPVLHTSLQAWFAIPGIDVAWTKIEGRFEKAMW